jgi:hypothetical protein
VTRFLAGIAVGLAVGTFAGVTLILPLLWKPQRVAARWVEPEDGTAPLFV